MIMNYSMFFVWERSIALIMTRTSITMPAPVRVQLQLQFVCVAGAGARAAAIMYMSAPTRQRATRHLGSTKSSNPMVDVDIKLLSTAMPIANGPGVIMRRPGRDGRDWSVEAEGLLALPDCREQLRAQHAFGGVRGLLEIELARVAGGQQVVRRDA